LWRGTVAHGTEGLAAGTEFVEHIAALLTMDGELVRETFDCYEPFVPKRGSAGAVSGRTDPVVTDSEWILGAAAVVAVAYETEGSAAPLVTRCRNP